MSLILCVETGTDVCSVGIAKDGELLSLRESDEGRDHARKVGVDPCYQFGQGLGLIVEWYYDGYVQFIIHGMSLFA